VDDVQQAVLAKDVGEVESSQFNRRELATAPGFKILAEIGLLVERGRVPLADTAGQALALDLDTLIRDFPEKRDLGLRAVLLGLLSSEIDDAVTDGAMGAGRHRIRLGAGWTGGDDYGHGCFGFLVARQTEVV
jgi:hypothetical protein